MSTSDVFHLGLTKADLQGATLAIVPGDPQRVEKIAALMDKPVKLASHREFTSWRAELDGKAVIICSTGIGGPSTSIAVEELAQLGIRTFLRVGTTGAIQPHINVGDVLVTTASVRLDGEEGDRYARHMHDCRKSVNAREVDPAFIAAVRRRLNLDQRQAAEFFGGGVNAFSRYETGKVAPPRPRVLLFKAFDKHPELFDELRQT